jgi:hypothetical protein
MQRLRRYPQLADHVRRAVARLRRYRLRGFARGCGWPLMVSIATSSGSKRTRTRIDADTEEAKLRGSSQLTGPRRSLAPSGVRGRQSGTRNTIEEPEDKFRLGHRALHGETAFTTQSCPRLVVESRGWFGLILGSCSVKSFCSIGTILPDRPARARCRRAQRPSRVGPLVATRAQRP